MTSLVIYRPNNCLGVVHPPAPLLERNAYHCNVFMNYSVHGSVNSVPREADLFLSVTISQCFMSCTDNLSSDICSHCVSLYL